VSAAIASVALVVDQPGDFVTRIVHRGRSHLGHVPILRGARGRLAGRESRRHPREVDEAQWIYRGEVTAMTIALADISVNVERILSPLEGGDDGEWEEEEDPSTDA
jgi:hypothetical protein